MVELRTGERPANVRTLAQALALTGTFLVVEVIGGLVTGSLALVSDAAHMLTDTIGFAIALAGVKLAQRPRGQPAHLLIPAI